MNELLIALRSLLGVGDELTEANAAQLIQAHTTAQEAAKTEAERKATDLDAQVQTLTAKVTDLEAGKDTKPKPDDDTIGMLVEGAEAGIDQLTQTGAITPAIAASLKTAFVGEQGKRNVYALSAAYSGHDQSLIKQICSILKDNKPVITQELTGGQFALSRIPAEPDDEKAAEEKVKSRNETLDLMVPQRTAKAAS